MNALSKLKLSDRSPQRNKIDKTLRSRLKLVSSLEIQINIVEAQAKGQVFQVDRVRWENNEDGSRQRSVKKVSPRAHFWEESDGAVYLKVMVGVRQLEIRPKNPTIQLQSKKDLIPTLKLLVQATEAGQLDDQIAATHSRAKTK